MNGINQTQCTLQPEGVVDLWVSQYKTTSGLASCSAALYGVNIALALSCVSLLLMYKEIGLSRQKQITTCVYIVTMIAIASHAVVHTIMNVDSGVIDNLRNPENPTRLVSAIFSPRMPVSLPLAVWGADAVLIYRCVILYRLAAVYIKMAMYIILVIGIMSSIGGGIAAYCISFTLFSSNHSQVVSSGVIPTTIFINGAVALLISARLIYAQRLLPDSLDQKRDSPYMTALVVCVESSALIVLVAVASIILQDAIVLMPQICVLSPLLIIYRVAQRRTERTMTRPEETLEFHHAQQRSVSSDLTVEDH